MKEYNVQSVSLTSSNLTNMSECGTATETLLEREGGGQLIRPQT